MASVCGAACAPGKRERIGVRWKFWWQGYGISFANAAFNRCHAVHWLPGDQEVSLTHGIAKSNRNRVKAASVGEFVHLAFVGKARLHDTESPHSATRGIVGSHRKTLDNCIGATVGTLGVRDAVNQHRRRCAGVGAPIKHHPRFDFDNLSISGGVVTHPDARRMSMDVTKEAFLAAVLHFDWSSSFQCEQAAMHLQADVVTRPERAAHATKDQGDILFG
jgi:hypothetical protein